MTLQVQDLKSEVGVRELHDRLSQYVHHVAAGAHVHVTVHGKVVAVLVPASKADPFAKLRERGLVRDPEDVEWEPTGKTSSKSEASDMVIEQRR